MAWRSRYEEALSWIRTRSRSPTPDTPNKYYRIIFVPVGNVLQTSGQICVYPTTPVYQMGSALINTVLDKTVEVNNAFVWLFYRTNSVQLTDNWPLSFVNFYLFENQIQTVSHIVICDWLLLIWCTVLGITLVNPDSRMDFLYFGVTRWDAA